MLLTNMAVAQHVAVNLPEQALLRRHDTPLERRLVGSYMTDFFYLVIQLFHTGYVQRKGTKTWLYYGHFFVGCPYAFF